MVSLWSFTPSMAGDDMALAAVETGGHILAWNSRRFFSPSQVIVNVVGESLLGWLTGDIWIALVGSVGWDLNRSLSRVDTGVRKWFWFHPSC